MDAQILIDEQSGDEAGDKIDLKKLKDFFSASDLEWLPKNCKKNKSGEYQVLVLPYMNRGAVMNRLDAVCGPENWQDDYCAGPNGGVMCRLSIRINGEWITKCDGAENTNIESVKGGISDAFKRAATKWGIGRYLARLPRMFGIVHQGGSEYTKYYPKGGDLEWVNFDIPSLPLEWLPPGEIPATPRQENPRQEKQKYPPIHKGNTMPRLTADKAKKEILAMIQTDQTTHHTLDEIAAADIVSRIEGNKPYKGGWLVLYEALKTKFASEWPVL